MFSAKDSVRPRESGDPGTVRAALDSRLRGNERSKAYWRIAFIAVAVLLAAVPLTFGAFWINMVITALIFSLAVFSINLLTGLTGLLSFGQAGFVGIGAYTLGVLAKQGHL